MFVDRRIPSRDVSVIRPILDRLAKDQPHKVFVKFKSGFSVTYSDLHALVVKTAIGLQQLGVKQGDHVLSWLPNDIDALRLYLAVNYIGAVFVPINTAYRGASLEHVINLSDAKLIVLHSDLADRLHSLSLTTLRSAVVLGGEEKLPAGIHAFGQASLLPSDGNLLPLDRPIEPWDTICITFTSGTTGLSKAVMSSYAQYFALSNDKAAQYIAAEDRYLISTPLFHISSTARVYAMLMCGGSIAMVNAFRTDDFWETVRCTESTTVTLMGAMANFLLQCPPATSDRTHGLKTVAMLPLVDNPRAFIERFGVDIYTFYNMTETSRPIGTELNPTIAGSCGMARPGVEARLVDENECEVPPGAVGELILRTDAPWAMSHGYYNDLDSTAKAWRNGWFHTGDGFRKDEEGNFYFVDRLKDSIRRRGENISSVQVETEVSAHPAIREVAAFPVPSEHGESEVMIAISFIEGCRVSPQNLVEFLIPRMPYFAVPRFIRVMDDLPKTPTQKIQKHLLKQAGVFEGTFDREKAGIRIRREKIG